MSLRLLAVRARSGLGPSISVGALYRRDPSSPWLCGESRRVFFLAEENVSGRLRAVPRMGALDENAVYMDEFCDYEHVGRPGHGIFG
ncbi:MAG: hypothetical protein B6U94_05535 [Thermofilum sp. ex4484_79]|nr:MAG: hypothetical protein B6U94_05535 [Thermofilum sp. ex4484_79]